MKNSLTSIVYAWRVVNFSFTKIRGSSGKMGLSHLFIDMHLVQ